ncbi:MAG TPA: MarP family serine protease [Acidimicrobiia bacterium]|nr:MarP family serine protease [Acidimicrobiia bacterium]
MNLLDAFLIAALLLAAYSGYRFGFAARALAWVGLALGLVVGAEFVDSVARALHGSTPRTKLLASLAFLLVIALVGQAIGFAVGSVLHRHLPRVGGFRTADRVAGAAAGVLGVLVVVWLLIPGLANAPGWPARAVRGSAIVREIDDVAPSPPSTLAALGRLVGAAPFPEVFRSLTASDVGAPPGQGIPAALVTPVANAVVKVEGQACDVLQDGSGVLVAPGVIVTNAHVVAGERATSVLVPNLGRLGAVVVAFDPYRDLAILRIPAIHVAPLGIADTTVGDTGGVFGYPGGGNEAEAPARVAERIDAEGTDIYHQAPTQRDVLVLAAKLVPGNSGGPLVNVHGQVVGIAFAIDPGASSTAYALATDEVNAVLRPVLASGTAAPVSTGSCLDG